jgi:large subunit ribosomal protein L23
MSTNKSPYEVLGIPLITERATALADSKDQPQYVFRVSPSVNKIEIRKAIEKVYNVKVTAVNTIKVKGKLKRQGRTQGKRADWKKAFVTLEKGQSLELL